MNNIEKVLTELAAAPGPVCDDCLARRAGIHPRQTVNDIGRGLEMSGELARTRDRRCVFCDRLKITNALRGAPAEEKLDHLAVPRTSHSASTSKPADDPLLSAPAASVMDGFPWHWEGHVQSALRRYLEAKGWTITRAAVTETKEAGIDLAATNDGRELFVEVKGFPLKTYAYGPKKGLPKPTQPTNQARQWYSHALLSLLRLCDAHPSASIALALPDFPTYRKLIGLTERSLALLGITVFLVSEHGHVEERSLGDRSARRT